MAMVIQVRHSLADSSLTDYVTDTMQGKQYLYQDTSISIVSISEHCGVVVFFCL